jgi:hypothetical protein
MTTLDPLAQQRSDIIIRDQHYRINTTSLRHSQAFAVSAASDIRGHYVLRSHPVTSLEVFFHDVSDTHALFRLRSLMPSQRAALARCRGERYHDRQ